MSVILIINELGGGKGHINALKSLIEELCEVEDNQVYLAIKDVRIDVNLNLPKKLHVLQAPVYLHQSTSDFPIDNSSFADILLIKGYDCVENLIPMVEAWEELFRIVRPDKVYYDHSPTALIASYWAKFEKINHSAPFTTLPFNRALEPLGELMSATICENITKKEAHIVNVINSTINSQLKFIGDLYRFDRTYIIGLPKLDMYAPDFRLNNTYYVRPSYSTYAYQKADWSDIKNIKIFAYLKNVEITWRIIQALNHLRGCEICLYLDYPNATQTTLHELRQNLDIVSIAPFDMISVINKADLIICHGGINLTTEAVINDIPVLIAPTQGEQRETAILIQLNKLGDMVRKYDSWESIHNKILQLTL